MITVPCRHQRQFELDPASTALLAIDFQRYFFTRPDGHPDDRLTAIVPAVAALIGVARALGCPVIYTRETYRADLADVSPYRRSLDYVGKPGPLGRALIDGEPGQQILAALAPAPGESIVDKPGFSAFCGSDLEDRLRTLGVERLILCGVTTQCCVHSTLREAVDRGYWCLTVADCCAASEPGLHEAALGLIPGEGHLFGWVCDLADIEQAAGEAGLAERKPD